jgi:diguanylate cyclase (GGDEF)-like protein
MTNRGSQVGQSLGRLLTREAQTYAGADQGNAARIVALLWVLSGLLTLAFLPFDHPTAATGLSGWALAAALVGGSLVGGRHVLHRQPPPGFTDLLALSYLGLAQVAALEWLAGGAGSAYQKLYLLWVASAMGIHPPRRGLAFLGATVLVASAPLLYDGWSAAAAASIATDVLLWSVLGVIVLALMVYVRAQRVRLRGEEEKAQRLARADALTELGNRRAFDEALDTEIARSERAHSTMSVALVDIDGLKRINDEFGHLDGDRCLRQVAQAVKRTMRGGDRGFRWGGDEFALLLPDTDHEGAEQAAARLASDVLNTCSDAQGQPLSVSWGAAQAIPGMTAEELLSQYDLSLMVQKRERLQLGGLEGIRRDRPS